VSRRRIAVCFPLFRPGGGSEIPALWAVEALKDDHDVTLISAGKLSLARLNEFYGTAIGEAEIRVVEVPLPRPFRSSFAAVRGGLLSRYCRRQASSHDLMISMYNVMDFGRKGIQFIADFSFDASLRAAYGDLPAGRRRWLYQPRLLRSAYIGASRRLAGTTAKGWWENVTVANSEWTRDVLRRAFGIPSEVIYPPVLAGGPPRPWAEKTNGFVFLGRVSLEKRIERIIDILARVRARRPGVHLHIVGDAQDSYRRRIEPLLRRHRDWVFVEGLKSGGEKAAVIDGHRFGISARANEPFGIAVAEMAAAGNLVFVPGGGGQVEIVDHPDLVYRDPDDACAKIERVLDDPSLQERLREHALARRGRFSPERFMAEVRGLVRRFFGESSVLPGP